MTKVGGIAAVTLVLSFGGWILVVPAQARPPTVMNSPGYDARLAESRAALAAPQAPVRYYKRVKVRTPRPITPKVGQ
ncbi:MAG: hypothetical protein WAL15_09045 [Xanthobacteraceae bacterium]|jgi:hypothetical protein